MVTLSLISLSAASELASLGILISAYLSLSTSINLFISTYVSRLAGGISIISSFGEVTTEVTSLTSRVVYSGISSSTSFNNFSVNLAALLFLRIPFNILLLSLTVGNTGESIPLPNLSSTTLQS